MRHGESALGAIDHEHRPDEIADPKRALRHEAAGPVGLAVAAHAHGGEAAGRGGHGQLRGRRRRTLLLQDGFHGVASAKGGSLGTRHHWRTRRAKARGYSQMTTTLRSAMS